MTPHVAGDRLPLSPTMPVCRQTSPVLCCISDREGREFSPSHGHDRHAPLQENSRRWLFRRSRKNHFELPIWLGRFQPKGRISLSFDQDANLAPASGVSLAWFLYLYPGRAPDSGASKLHVSCGDTPCKRRGGRLLSSRMRAGRLWPAFWFRILNKVGRPLSSALAGQSSDVSSAIFHIGASGSLFSFQDWRFPSDPWRLADTQDMSFRDEAQRSVLGNLLVVFLRRTVGILDVSVQFVPCRSLA